MSKDHGRTAIETEATVNIKLDDLLLESGSRQHVDIEEGDSLNNLSFHASHANYDLEFSNDTMGDLQVLQNS